MTDLIAGGNSWFNKAEARTTAMKARIGRNMQVDYPQNIKELWNRIKANPKTTAEVVTVDDLYLLIANEINFAEIDNPPVLNDGEKPADNLLDDRKPFFQWLEANENARKVLHAILQNKPLPELNLTKINLDQITQPALDIFILPFKQQASAKLKKQLQENEQFARELFLLAPQTAALFSAEELAALMLKNRGAAMTIAQTPTLANKLTNHKFTPEQIINLLATPANPDAPWQATNRAYHAAILNFLLRYCRKDLDDSGLLDQLNKDAFPAEMTEENKQAIIHLHALLRGGKYSEILADTIQADSALFTRISKHEAMLSSFMVSVRDPIARLKATKRAVDVNSQNIPIGQLKSAGEAIITHQAKEEASNKALLDLVTEPRLRKTLDFTVAQEIRWMENSSYHPEVCKFYAKEKYFIHAVKNKHSEEKFTGLISSSAYFSAANTIKEGIQKADGGIFKRASISEENFCVNFAGHQNLDQSVCALLAEDQNYMQHLAPEYSYILGFIPWPRSAEVVAQERRAYGNRSPFFARYFTKQSLIQLALSAEYGKSFGDALECEGSDILLYETLLTANEQQLSRLTSSNNAGKDVNVSIRQDGDMKIPNAEVAVSIDITAKIVGFIEDNKLFKQLPSATQEMLNRMFKKNIQLFMSPSGSVTTQKVDRLGLIFDAGTSAQAESKMADDKQEELGFDDQRVLIAPDAIASSEQNNFAEAPANSPQPSPTKSQLAGMKTVDPTPVKKPIPIGSTAACIAHLASPTKQVVTHGVDAVRSPSQSSAVAWNGHAERGSTHSTPESRTSAKPWQGNQSPKDNVPLATPISATPASPQWVVAGVVVNEQYLSPQSNHTSGSAKQWTGPAAGSTQATPQSISSAAPWTGANDIDTDRREHIATPHQ